MPIDTSTTASTQSGAAVTTPSDVTAIVPDDTFVPGELTSFDYSPEEFVPLTDTQQNLIKELVLLASRTNVASRRFEVEQAWEARLFERGYQHLLPRRGGGWSLPGEGSKWGPLSTADSSALYSTNIYGRDKDIITGAIARETPKLHFFPENSEKIADVLAAEAANKYKDVYERNNALRERLAELAYYYYTDGRAILYTRLVMDAQQFGTNPDGSPRGREITSIFGKLEGKVPVEVSYQKDMQFIQLYKEIDVSSAKARYPWVAKNIRPGSCGIGEIELDKIARVNTRLSLLGSYVTGDAMMREVTEQYTWLRPEMFFDELITDENRDFFLTSFPKGALVVFAGQQFCFARNESMDDHLVVTHAMPGIGQNRRALGTNVISVQKRLNAYFDIMDDFFRKTVPRRHYHAEAFDIAALQAQDNVPGGSGPYLPQPGMTAAELVFVEPTPQPQPALPEFTKMFFDEMPASLSGAVPSLYGGSTNTDTVGGISIQRDQALGRIGISWNAAKEAFCMAGRQAVMAAADRTSPINDTLPKVGTVVIDPQILKGNIVIYPEYDQAFPESWKERETRYTEIVQNAGTNPFYAAMLGNPSNMRAIADNIRMSDLTIPGEDSVKKQLTELESLKASAPMPNPQLLQLQQGLEQAKAGMMSDAAKGAQIPPEAEQMVQQLEQHIQTLPQLVSSIPVAQDASENHAIEAMTVFEFINSQDGLKLKNGAAQEQAAFQNCLLHWQEHTAMAKKLAPPKPPEKVPSISFKGEDLSPDAQTQALAQAGISSTPVAQKQNKLINTQHDIAKKVVPKSVPAAENINVHKIRRGQ